MGFLIISVKITEEGCENSNAPVQYLSQGQTVERLLYVSVMITPRLRAAATNDPAIASLTST